MRTIALGLLAIASVALPARAQFEETITVARVLVDARVTDHRGTPLRGLTPADFNARIGGKVVQVQSVTFIDESPSAWIDQELAESEESDAQSADQSAAPTATQGRLFVVFVQTDFARNNVRVTGHMNFSPHAERFIEALLPEDRVAVFSFDSHLKFRLDFTSNKDTVSHAIRQALLIDDPPPPPIVHSPALASRLDRQAMKRVTSSEAALLLIGNALIPIGGPKNLILMGWGLGVLSSGSVVMRPEWTAAQRALDVARVTLFAFDTTFADYHDLELGLKSAAQQTGGFYAKTHAFPQIGLERLQRTLTGRYEIELRLPDALPAGTHDLTIKVQRRGAVVLAPTSIVAR
jgi:VWFA-related protein